MESEVYFRSEGFGLKYVGCKTEFLIKISDDRFATGLYAIKVFVLLLPITKDLELELVSYLLNCIQARNKLTRDPYHQRSLEWVFNREFSSAIWALLAPICIYTKNVYTKCIY